MTTTNMSSTEEAKKRMVRNFKFVALDLCLAAANACAVVLSQDLRFIAFSGALCGAALAAGFYALYNARRACVDLKNAAQMGWPRPANASRFSTVRSPKVGG